MQDNDLFGKCPYYTSQKILSGKWALYILYELREHETIRFNEMLRLMPENMTSTTLSRQLKALEEAGMIVRKEYSQIPPKVEYTLSDIGQEIKPLLNALGEWGEKYNHFLASKDSN